MIAYFLCGFPGCGKSTYTSTLLDVVQISRDIIRAELGYIKPGVKAVLTREQEDKVTKAQYNKIRQCAKENKSIVIDDTNLNPKFRTPMLNFLRECGFEIWGVNIPTDIEICIERRKNDIPKDVMYRIAANAKFLEKNEVDYLTTYLPVINKKQLIEYVKEAKGTTARNAMGCNESWYDPFYAIKHTFSMKEIENMSDDEAQHLYRLAESISDALY